MNIPVQKKKSVLKPSPQIRRTVMNENAVLLFVFMLCSGAAVCVLVSAVSGMTALGRSLCGRGQGPLLLSFFFPLLTVIKTSN